MRPANLQDVGDCSSNKLALLPRFDQSNRFEVTWRNQVAATALAKMQQLTAEEHRCTLRLCTLMLELTAFWALVSAGASAVAEEANTTGALRASAALGTATAAAGTLLLAMPLIKPDALSIIAAVACRVIRRGLGADVVFASKKLVTIKCMAGNRHHFCQQFWFTATDRAQHT
jgi:hypothetical protein